MFSTLLSSMRNEKTLILSNVAEGTHQPGRVTYTAQSTITAKYLFGKLVAGGLVALSGSSNVTTGARAIGVITDEADAIGDPVSVDLIGATGGTMMVTTAGAFAVGDLVTANTSSQAVTFASQPAGATYYIYGIAITAAAAGERVEFVPTPGVTQAK